MRSFLVMAMFTASLASAAVMDYTEERQLELPASGIDTLDIDAGAGSMTVRGVQGRDAIRVTALIQVDQRNADKARKEIESRVTLDLVRDGDDAELRALIKDGFMQENIAIRLEIEIPVGMHLKIEDSSGSIKISDTAGDIDIEDSAGSITVAVARNVTIDDSSGSIEVSDATGDVDVEDGSGSMTVRRVKGSVRIDDGSGSIRVSDVERDVTIEESGSGGVSITNVGGVVRQDG